ncbi:MAG: regulatory protein RecX [Candidatus Kerfeldbacteria bacterium]
MNNNLPTSEDFQHIKEKLIDYLSRQGFSEAKLIQKVTDLKRRYPKTKRYFFYTKENIIKVTNELKDLGLINDRKYAESVLRQLKDRKDGIQRIRQKMYTRLIPTSIINEVLGEWQDQGTKQDDSIIIRDAKRKYERLCEKHQAKKEKYTIQTKLYAFIAQKGYTPDQIKEIIGKI